MHILVPTDGSPYARLAIDEAAELAGALQADITVMTVSESVNMAAFAPLITMEVSHDRLRDLDLRIPAREEAQAILDEAAERFRAHGVEPGLLHEVGDPAETILRIAEQARADLILLGSHGRTGIRRFLLGSVSEKVTRHAPCSVWIARGRPLKVKES